jgi:hypothetical protein
MLGADAISESWGVFARKIGIAATSAAVSALA